MIPTLDMIGLIVDDLQKSFDFYRMLGLEIPTVGRDEEYAECTIRGGIRLSWNTVALAKQLDANWVPPVGTRVGLAFLCENPASVDSTYAEITAAGYKGVKEPWDAFWGQRYGQVEDPDGNVIDLFAPLS